jgi:SAM-dependent methyltransferase
MANLSDFFGTYPAFFNPRKYPSQDHDTVMFLNHFQRHCGSNKKLRILEVGANEEDSACILADAGHSVIGVDLRPDSNARTSFYYHRIRADFNLLAKVMEPDSFDVAFATSALEHFGRQVYGTPEIDGYDKLAVELIWRVLKPGGWCFITVPYGKHHRIEPHWRIYNHESLSETMIQNFKVVEKTFFLSGDCVCPHQEGIVTAEDANNYEHSLPHLTVLLVMQKEE